MFLFLLVVEALQSSAIDGGPVIPDSAVGERHLNLGLLSLPLGDLGGKLNDIHQLKPFSYPFKQTFTSSESTESASLKSHSTDCLNLIKITFKIIHGKYSNC